MPVFKTPFNGYAVLFSPFYEGRLLVGASQNFGILGNGRLHVLDIDPASGAFAELRSFETADGIYDCAWSESHDSVAVAAVADGSVKLWVASLPPARSTPSFGAPATPTSSPPPPATAPPASGTSASSDPPSGSPPTTTRSSPATGTSTTGASSPPPPSTSPSAPWPTSPATATASGRSSSPPTGRASSYDMTVCMWDCRAEDALIGRYDHHIDFVVGVDCLLAPGGTSWSTSGSTGRTQERCAEKEFFLDFCRINSIMMMLIDQYGELK